MSGSDLIPSWVVVFAWKRGEMPTELGLEAVNYCSSEAQAMHLALNLLEDERVVSRTIRVAEVKYFMKPTFSLEKK